MWIGRGYGLNLRTNTESPILFQTGGYSSAYSMQISGSGTRDVTSIAPFKANENATFDKNVTITGALTTSSFYANKPWVALKYTGTITPAGSPGFNQSGITVSNPTSGTYTFTIPTHPSGTNYMVFVSQIASGGTPSATSIANYNVLVNSATSFTVYSKTTASAVTPSNFYVYTVP